jgi:hypothetical protein
VVAAVAGARGWWRRWRLAAGTGAIAFADGLQKLAFWIVTKS